MIQRAYRVAQWVALWAACSGLAACSPALDWREVRPPDTRLLALFPCKPVSQARTVRLAGQDVSLTVQACSAGSLTWGLAHADLADPRQLGAAMDELRRSAAANIGAAAPAASPTPLQVAGATPHGSSALWHLTGRKPDGQPVAMQQAVFVHGTRVFQATVLGERVAGEEPASFFSGLRFLP